ncbi:MAG: hypothetical protein AB7E21_04280 [Pseudodonghicola sp.]
MRGLFLSLSALLTRRESTSRKWNSILDGAKTCGFPRGFLKISAAICDKPKKQAGLLRPSHFHERCKIKNGIPFYQGDSDASPDRGSPARNRGMTRRRDSQG